jgi:hypothetical protein
MDAAGRRAVMGGGILATLTAGIVIGLAVTNGSADEQSPTVETTETTVVQVQVTETLPPTTVSAAVVSTEAPAVAAPTVEAVTTTPEAVAPAPIQPAEPTRAADNPAPQVSQGEGVIVGPSAEPGATVAPPPGPMPGIPTEPANGGAAG